MVRAGLLSLVGPLMPPGFCRYPTLDRTLIDVRYFCASTQDFHPRHAR